MNSAFRYILSFLLASFECEGEVWVERRGDEEAKSTEHTVEGGEGVFDQTKFVVHRCVTQIPASVHGLVDGWECCRPV